MQCWKACGDPQLQGGIIAEGLNLKFFLAPNLNRYQLLLLMWEKNTLQRHMKSQKV